MINFSGIDYYSTIGRVLRKFLSLVPSNAVIPIIQGPMRGMKWLAGSFNHGCWLGSYELEKQRFLADFVKPGMIIYDIGAHVGFYTLYFSTLVGPQGKVYAFEPARRNLNYLFRHIRLNHLANVNVEEAAVGQSSGHADFIFHPHSSSTSHLLAKNEIPPEIRETVQLIKLDDFIRCGYPLPDLIKMDIEGAEFQALKGMKQLLVERKPVLSISIHGQEVLTQCLSYLDDLSYKIFDLNKKPLIPERYYDEIFSR